MVSPDPLFAFWPLLWSARARGCVIFVSDNVSDSLSDDIEKYLLPRYLDARDRVQYSSIMALRGFSISTAPLMSIEIFKQPLHTVSKFLNIGMMCFYF